MKPELCQKARLAMTFSLSQALGLLQMPQAELASWLLAEVEKNPLLELDALPPSIPYKGEPFVEPPPSLHEHLMAQIRERFPDPTEAIQLLEELDERGFLPPLESPLLPILQTFDPPGIFARNLRECLLLQLDSNSPAYRIVCHFFKDLLDGRFEAIKKKTGIEDLGPLIRTLAKLSLRPADLFRQEYNPPIVADLSISKIGKTWIIETDDEELPKFHLRADYLSLDDVQEWTLPAKWLLRSLKRRKSILLKLGALLVRKQAAFLDGRGPLQPLSIQKIAKEIGLHESTLSRALADKYARTPRGILPLRSLVSSALEPVKLALQKLIEQEDKKRPFSDEEIVSRLQEMGMKIARRTVAKYRHALKIAPASIRKFLT